MNRIWKLFWIIKIFLNFKKEGSNLINELGSLLQKESVTQLFLLKKFTQLGSLLQEPILHDYVLESVQQQLLPKLWRSIDLNSNKCRDPSKLPQTILILELQFISDLLLAGANSTTIDQNAVINLIYYCAGIEDIYKTLSIALYHALNSTKGIESLQGMLHKFSKEMKSIEFGPSHSFTTFFISKWAETGKMTEKDKIEICPYINYLVDHSDTWNKLMNRNICSLSLSVPECPDFQRVNLQRLKRLDECLPLFEKTNI